MNFSGRSLPCFSILGPFYSQWTCIFPDLRSRLFSKYFSSFSSDTYGSTIFFIFVLYTVTLPMFPSCMIFRALYSQSQYQARGSASKSRVLHLASKRLCLLGTKPLVLMIPHIERIR